MKAKLFNIVMAWTVLFCLCVFAPDRTFAFAPTIRSGFPLSKERKRSNNQDLNSFVFGKLAVAYHQPTVSTASSKSADNWVIPQISTSDLNQLDKNGYIVIPHFISDEFTNAVRNDISQLRFKDHFKVARIGQSSTNTLNTEIRVAETCFIDNTRTDRDSILPPSKARQDLCQTLENLRQDLASTLGNPLDSTLTELLYAYYPSGGFYRRHRDAIPGSASTLRTYSLLLYLNQDWEPSHGGNLRLHMDSGGDFLPQDAEPNFLDVEPKAGTLVLFKSDMIPHEVLDTTKERMAVVGWYNRFVTQADAKELLVAEGSALIRPALLLVSVALVAYGVSLFLG